VTFAVAAEAYDLHVGRYGARLGEELVRVAGIDAGQRALDVGAGAGALTRVLVDRLGAENVTALEPSETFVAALEARLPGVDVRRGAAEELPFADDEFDAAFAQLVVNFLADPERGVAEIRRVVRPGGVVAACVWDYPGEMTLLRAFWEAAASLDPEGAAAVDERVVMGFDESGELALLLRRAGLHEVSDGALVVSADYAGFDDLWAPFLRGVGPSGAYATALAAAEQEAFRDEYRRRLGDPEGPFRLSARAWYAVGTV
jgi:SAM-dependent methyltransferase